MLKSKSKKSKKAKNVRVDRKFLMNLANDIYNSKTHKFLRLCNGKLQNGPDPTDEDRPMHCGLGELYFRMTGYEPNETGVDESDVVNLAVELSPLAGLREKKDAEARAKLDKAIAAIKKMGLSDDLESNLLYSIDEEKDAIANTEEDERDDEETFFRAALDDIPGENDDGCEDDSCTVANYRERSKRVAAQIRQAASYLPR